MVEQALKQVIPSQLSIFKKLTPGHDPYHFGSWDKEGGVPILRYWFWIKAKTKKERKRVFINEVGSLLKLALQADYISRSDFRNSCPLTIDDGECGYAVTMRIFEYFQIVEVLHGKCRIKNREKIKELLGQ
jgi:hypothetical protein